ncbi:MAG TPA: hypothetical protein VFW40_13110, partial [Capsulimonadaceae bacterium]|nr:hypothetical protein [Capsulimonadaceae bacterium]
MSVAVEVGKPGQDAAYEVADNELAVGSTLGGSKAATIIKANGALQLVYSIDMGAVLFGTFILRHYDETSGMHLAQTRAGTFILHPAHQEHRFSLAGGIDGHETVFILNRGDWANDTDPPAVYYVVELKNSGNQPIQVGTYAFAELRGNQEHNIIARYDEESGTLLAWNESQPDLCRIFGCSEMPESYETTLDMAKAVSGVCPGALSGKLDAPADPLGVLHHSHKIAPGKTAQFHYILSFGKGRSEARANFQACPEAGKALEATRKYYHGMLERSVMMTPNPQVNLGVLWAKANMLRVMANSPTGRCFVNDPTRSNNSVARDTAWFAYGGDYLDPVFVREALAAYVRYQEKSGKYVEYYDIRNGKTADYKLNINDDTPLIILALWHHYNTTGDRDFLREIYSSAAKAARYILSQRNDQGLVWCTSTGTSDWGIIGWRNVIQNYRLSGATTEVNSECYAALATVSHMARVLEKHDESAEFSKEAEKLKTAINTHLLNPDNGLYYLNIDVDGYARSDVTSDLVFPVMFGVATAETSARIIGRLSDSDFWTVSGMRTTPRDSPNYTPEGGWGLLGGVWVAVSFWYAFAAAQYSPEFMDHALSASFRNFSMDPRRNNTVPGQFSEWLHGETLVNEGMMLSPWDPPRYLWAAIEGAAGLDLSADSVGLNPKLASDWKWMAVRNLPFRGNQLAWVVVRTPDIQIYTNFHPQRSAAYRVYEEDITELIHVGLDSICAFGLRQGSNLV